MTWGNRRRRISAAVRGLQSRRSRPPISPAIFPLRELRIIFAIPSRCWWIYPGPIRARPICPHEEHHREGRGGICVNVPRITQLSQGTSRPTIPLGRADGFRHGGGKPHDNVSEFRRRNPPSCLLRGTFVVKCSSHPAAKIRRPTQFGLQSGGFSGRVPVLNSASRYGLPTSLPACGRRLRCAREAPSQFPATPSRNSPSFRPAGTEGFLLVSEATAGRIQGLSRSTMPPIPRILGRPSPMLAFVPLEHASPPRILD